MTQTLPPGYESFAPLLAWQATADEYFADPAVSRSDLKIFAHSRSLFHRCKVLGQDIGDGSTKEQTLGTDVHGSILNPLWGRDTIVQIPQSALSASGARAGKNWLAFKEEHPDKILLNAADYDRMRQIVDSVRIHPVLGHLLNEPGLHEVSLRFQAPAGILGKARLDRVVFDTCLLDLKTTSKPLDAKTIAYEAKRWGWPSQVAWYQDAVRAVLEADDYLPFIFGVISSKYPYEVVAVELQDKWIREARDWNERQVAGIAKCLASGDWQRPDRSKVITLAEPPSNDAAWEVAD